MTKLRTPLTRIDLLSLEGNQLPHLQSIAKLMGIRAYGRTRRQLIEAIREAAAEQEEDE